MKLVETLHKICLLSSFILITNTAAAMSSEMDDLKLPNFVCASEKTKVILSKYTEAGYLELFENNFPVLNLNNIVDVASTVSEIRDFSYAPGLTFEVKSRMEKIANDLILYLRNKITENKNVLLPAIEAHWQNLSVEQQDVLKDICAKHNCLCVAGFAACGFATAAVAIAFFILKNYPNQECLI